MKYRFTRRIPGIGRWFWHKSWHPANCLSELHHATARIFRPSTWSCYLAACMQQLALGLVLSLCCSLLFLSSNALATTSCYENADSDSFNDPSMQSAFGVSASLSPLYICMYCVAFQVLEIAAGAIFCAVRQL
jgi:hypothetical protein